MGSISAKQKSQKTPKDKRIKYDSEKHDNRKKARNKEKRRNKEETESDDGKQSKKIGRRKVWNTKYNINRAS